MYCQGPGKYFSDNIKLLINSGLTTTEASVAAVFTNYSPYDTIKTNPTAQSYLMKAVQVQLRDAGLPVIVTGSLTPETENYLKRQFGDWMSKPWRRILTQIRQCQSTLADDLIENATPTVNKKSIPWGPIAGIAASLLVLRHLFKKHG